MNASAILTMTFGLIIGSAIGVAAFTGVIPIPGLGSPASGELVSGQGTGEGSESSDTSEAEKADKAEELQAAKLELDAKTEAYFKKHPNDQKRAKLFGGTLVEMGEYERAEKFYKNRLSVNPTNTEMLFGLGWAYEKSKDWSAAIETYSTAYQSNPRHIGTLNNLAWVLATAPEESLRDGERALSLAKEAMELAGKNAVFVADTLAAAYAEVGEFDTAIEVQEWLVAKSPRDKVSDAQWRLELYKRHEPFRIDR